jgi:hypothetical protein
MKTTGTQNLITAEQVKDAGAPRLLGLEEFV